jgi:uncharacterized membrane protein YfcA
MAVTKLDVSLAARAASHLYLTTSIPGFPIYFMLIVAPLNLIVGSLNPFSPTLVSIGVCLLVLGIGYSSAVYYARRELNFWAYVIATPFAVSIGAMWAYYIALTLPSEPASNLPLLLIGPLLFVSYSIRVLIDYGRLWRSDHNALSIPQLRLANEVSKLLRKRRSLVPWVHVPTNPSRMFVYAILFAMSGVGLSVIVIIFYMAFHDKPPESRGAISALGPWFLPMPLAALAAMAALIRRHYVLRADRVLELDNRQPILFLRSFANDKVRLWGKGIVGKLRRRTIDEAIKRSAERLGPFIAIANPNTNLPRLGASQTYFSNDTWHNAIARWVQMAQMIVMVAGRTEGIRWELDHIFSNEEQTKLAIFVPPAMRKDSVAAARWFGEHFSHTRYGQDFSAIDPRRVIGIAFREDGLFVVETKRIHRREVDYLVALQAIIFSMVVTASAK